MSSGESPATSGMDGNREGYRGAPSPHRFEHGNPESFVLRWVDQRVSAVVKRIQFSVAHVLEMQDPVQIKPRTRQFRTGNRPTADSNQNAVLKILKQAHGEIKVFVTDSRTYVKQELAFANSFQFFRLRNGRESAEIIRDSVVDYRDVLLLRGGKVPEQVFLRVLGYADNRIARCYALCFKYRVYGPLPTLEVIFGE